MFVLLPRAECSIYNKYEWLLIVWALVLSMVCLYSRGSKVVLRKDIQFIFDFFIYSEI